MILRNEIDTLLREDFQLECYYLVIEEFVCFFAKLNDITINQEELKNKENLDKIFYFLCWKMVENYPSIRKKIYRLKELRYDVILKKDREEVLDIYDEIIQIYEELSYNEIKKSKIDFKEEIKELVGKEEYRLAVDVIEQIYYASKFRNILNKYNIKYCWYSNCKDLSYKIQYNIEELAPYVEDIGYEGDVDSKYKLEMLIDDMKYFEQII